MLTYHYDNANRLDYVTDSEGGTRTYEFDNNNQLRARTFTDGTNDLRIEYDYNLRNQVEEIRRYSDLTGTTLVSKTNIVYLDNGLVDTITHRDGTNALIDDFNYDYDELNRVIQETSHLGPTRNHDYDPINQLLDDGTDSFTYDKNHNRTMAGYSTTTGNRLASDGIWNFGYDNEGNRTSQTKIIGGEVWLFTYNHNNQLTKAEHKASSVSAVDLSVEYGYDVFNNRISRAVDADGAGAGAAVVEKFAFEGSNAWADLDNAGSLTTRRVFGDSIDELIARIDSNGVAWYLQDRLNSVRDIVDSTGALINHIDYASYGLRTETHPANGDRYGFTGQEHDDLTGLLDYGNRWYDVYVGMFVQQDPISFAGGLTNLSDYVGNNPSNLTDPTGLQQAGNPNANIRQRFLNPPPSPLDGFGNQWGQLDRMRQERTRLQIIGGRVVVSCIRAQGPESNPQAFVRAMGVVASKIVAIGKIGLAVGGMIVTGGGAATGNPAGAVGFLASFNFLRESVAELVTGETYRAAPVFAGLPEADARALDQAAMLLGGLLPGPPAAPAARTPFQWSNAELQAAADSISHAAFGANGVTGVPISVTVTPSGRVIVSQARQVPSVAARERAREIFGENVEFVRGTTGSNAPGLRGGDAEARAIHFLGDEARGARQATTHYACPECEARQNAAGVINVTGTQSQHGQITRPIGGN